MLLHAAVFASGFAGLVWQVLWVRQLTWVTGATTEAAAIGTAVFLAGLGAGAWLGGGWADRGRPMRRLATVEVLVGALGLALATAIPHLGALPDLSTVGALGWRQPSLLTLMAQVGIAALLLGPPCVAMGATLPLAVRAAVGMRVERAGWRVGLIYAVNTAGAALGAIAADLLLVPALGVWGAQAAAAVINLIAAALAALVPVVREPESWVTAPPGRPGRAAAYLALIGFAGLGLEIVHVRFLGSALGPYRAVFSLVLGVHLVGLQGGAVAGALWTRLGGRAGTGLTVLTAVFTLGAFFGFLAFDPEWLVRRQLEAVPDVRQVGALFALLRVDLSAVIAVVLLPALALGAAFPLANALAQDDHDTVGRRAGGLALASTLGNASGALVTGFVLLPMLGMQGTLTVLGACAVVAGAVTARGLGWLAPVAGVIGTAAWLTVPSETILWKSFPANRAQSEGILAVREGVHGTVVVSGAPEGPARLWTDGHPMTSTTEHAQRYMRVLAHAPLLMQAEPKTAVIIGFGVGNTTHAAALHDLERVAVVDRSPDVLAHAGWFTHANRGVLDRPEVVVHVDDGRHHLYTQPPASLDLIALEPPPIGHAGVASLYSSDLYRLARTRLTETGAIAQWLPAYQVPAEAVASLVRSFVDVFPDAVLLLPAGREMVLVGRLQPTPFEPERVAANLAARPAVARDLERFGLRDPEEWVVMFGADGEHLAEITASAPPVTDDRPSLEHTASSHVMETRLPDGLLAPSRWSVWCPSCDVQRLGERLGVTERIVEGPDFGRFSNLVAPMTTTGVPLVDATVEERRVIAESPSLRALVGER